MRRSHDDGTGWLQFRQRAIDLPITLIRERSVSPSGEEQARSSGQVSNSQLPLASNREQPDITPRILRFLPVASEA
jgi:hypothetical protein